MAQIIKYVDPDATGDANGTTWEHAYTALRDCITAEAQDLTDGGGDYFTAYCRSSGGTADISLAVNITGWTTGAANYIEIIGTDFPGTGVWDNTAYRLERTNQFNIVNQQENYVRYYNIQFLVNNTNTTAHGIVTLTGGIDAGNQTIIGNCIFKCIASGTAAAGSAIYFDDQQTIATVYNSTFYGWVRGAQTGFRALFFDGTTINMFNNVAYGCYIGYGEYGGVATIQNCAVGNCTNDFDGIAAGDINYCCSDDGDGGNSTGPQGGNWANEFTDAGNGNFTPLGGTGLATAGVNDPSSGVYSADIISVPYVTDAWTRGAYSIAAAGGRQLVNRGGGINSKLLVGRV